MPAQGSRLVEYYMSEIANTEASSGNIKIIINDVTTSWPCLNYKSNGKGLLYGHGLLYLTQRGEKGCCIGVIYYHTVFKFCLNSHNAPESNA